MGKRLSTRRVERISLAVAGTAGALYLFYLIRSIEEAEYGVLDAQLTRKKADELSAAGSPT